MSVHIWQWLVLVITLACIAYLGWKRPQSLILVLAATVALEISREWFPALGGLGKALGTVDLTRLVSLSLIVVAGWQLLRHPAKRQTLAQILREPLTWSLLVYLGLGAASVLYSVDRAKTVIEVIRLGILLLLFLSIAINGRREDALLPFKVIHTVALLLLPLTLYEALTKHFVWQQFLAQVNPPRVNATFVDPNIFARYLVLAIVSNLLLQLHTQDKKSRWWYLAALAGLLGGLAVTLSRSGMVTLVVVLGLLLLLKPEKRVLQPIGFVLVLGMLISLLHPTVWQRVLTFGQGTAAFDTQRLSLWKGAIFLIKGHPLLGVGLGGFQKAFLTTYLGVKNPYGATLSHTTVLTIAAELGIVGLIALAGIWFCLVRSFWRLRSHPESYLVGVGYLLWVVAIFISSQAEARFFEDPLIWIAMAMILSLGHVRKKI